MVRSSWMIAGFLSWCAVTVGAQEITTRASVDSSGSEGNAGSRWGSLSRDGRYVTFESAASNLVAGDTNGESDAFVRDRVDGTTTRVSVNSQGQQGNGPSYAPVISATGRHVVFDSLASNLVSGDSNNKGDIFLHDRELGTTVLVSLDSAGVQSNDHCNVATVSADGTRVAFQTAASNLVTGDGNGQVDIFVRDLSQGTTIAVSVDSSGSLGDGLCSVSEVSADGRYVAFSSLATNLVAGDTNGTMDVFRHDLQTGVTERVSVSSVGAQSQSASESYAIGLLSATGRFVGFHNGGDDLDPADQNGQVDAFLRDCDLGITTLVSVAHSGLQGDGASEWPTVSADGTHVVFTSRASNLVEDDTNGRQDVFLKSLSSGAVRRVSMSSAGVEGDLDSYYANLSNDGRHVAYFSSATNLVQDDGNGEDDILVWGPELNLSVNTTQVALRGNLTLSSWNAQTGTLGLLFVTEVSGNLFLLKLGCKAYDSAGVMEFSFTIPNESALSGLEIGFQSFGRGPFSSRVLISNKEKVTIL